MLVLVLSLLLLYNVGSSRLRLLEVQFLTYITLIKRSLLQETGFQKSLSRSRCTSETGGLLNPFLILSIGSGSLGDGFGPMFQTTLKIERFNGINRSNRVSRYRLSLGWVQG